MKYFSMFSGIGTGEKGIEQAFSNKYESAKSESSNGESGRLRAADIGRDDVLPANNSAFRNGGGKECLDLSASDSQRSTDTPKRSIATTGPNTETLVTQPGLFATTSRTSTFSSRDFLARLSVLLESDAVLMKPAALSFLRSHGFYHTKDPHIFYSKTLRAYLATTMDALSSESIPFSPGSVIEWKGCCLIQKTTGFPKTGSECSLSDILEASVAEKYFLSEKTMQGLLKGQSSPQLLTALRPAGTAEECTQ